MTHIKLAVSPFTFLTGFLLQILFCRCQTWLDPFYDASILKERKKKDMRMICSNVLSNTISVFHEIQDYLKRTTHLDNLG